MRRILIVDDDPGISALLRTLFEEEQYAVEVASNGHEALSKVAAVRPDVILSDVMMPILDGRRLFAAIQADPDYRSIPVILMSAAMPGKFTNGERPVAFIAKPFDIEALLATVDRILSGQAAT